MTSQQARQESTEPTGHPYSSERKAYLLRIVLGIFTAGICCERLLITCANSRQTQVSTAESKTRNPQSCQIVQSCAVRDFPY